MAVPKEAKTVTPRTLYRSDPLLRLVHGRLRWKPLFVAAVLVALQAIAFLVGVLLSYWLEQSGVPVTPIYDTEELYLTLVELLWRTPIAMLVYVWQPLETARVIGQLERNGILSFDSSSKEATAYQRFKDRFTRAINSPIWTILAGIVLGVDLLLHSLYTWPAEVQAMYSPPYFLLNKWYLYLLFTPVRMIPKYATALFIMRLIMLIVWLNRLFREVTPDVRPMHPDNVGGFGPLGGFASHLGLTIVAMGVALALYTCRFVFLSNMTVWRPELVGWYVIYVVLTPTVLILPLWSAHKAMVEVRDRELESISNQIDQELGRLARRSMGASSKQLKDENNRLAEMIRRRGMIRQSFPTWPVSISGAREFSLAAVLPLVPGVLSLVVELIA